MPGTAERQFASPPPPQQPLESLPTSSVPPATTSTTTASGYIPFRPTTPPGRLPGANTVSPGGYKAYQPGISPNATPAAGKPDSATGPKQYQPYRPPSHSVSSGSGPGVPKRNSWGAGTPFMGTPGRPLSVLGVPGAMVGPERRMTMAPAGPGQMTQGIGMEGVGPRSATAFEPGMAIPRKTYTMGFDGDFGGKMGHGAGVAPLAPGGAGRGKTPLGGFWAIDPADVERERERGRERERMVTPPPPATRAKGRTPPPYPVDDDVPLTFAPPAARPVGASMSPNPATYQRPISPARSRSESVPPIPQQPRSRASSQVRAQSPAPPYPVKSLSPQPQAQSMFKKPESVAGRAASPLQRSRQASPAPAARQASPQAPGRVVGVGSPGPRAGQGFPSPPPVRAVSPRVPAQSVSPKVEPVMAAVVQPILPPQQQQQPVSPPTPQVQPQPLVQQVAPIDPLAAAPAAIPPPAPVPQEPITQIDAGAVLPPPAPVPPSTAQPAPPPPQAPVPAERTPEPPVAPTQAQAQDQDSDASTAFLDQLASLLPATTSPLPSPRDPISHVYQTLATLPPDFSFIAALQKAHIASAAATRTKIEEARRARQEAHDKVIDQAYTAQDIGYGDLADLDEEFKAKEAALKKEEDKAEYDAYAEQVFTPVYERLTREIAELVERWRWCVDVGLATGVSAKETWDVVEVEVQADGGKKVVSGRKVILVEVLGVLLQCYHAIEMRYAKVTEAVVERDKRYRKMVISGLYEGGKITEMKSQEKFFDEKERGVLAKGAAEKRERVTEMQRVVEEAVMRGLEEDLGYTEEVTRLAKGVLEIVEKDAAKEGEQWARKAVETLERAYRVLEEAHKRSVRYFEVFWEAGMEVAKAEFEYKLAKAKEEKPGARWRRAWLTGGRRRGRRRRRG
ncbi:hypothetical protein BDZ91DRAFT_312060 [Kalaharituber pfeilii]|nr:hypothetical protein BDZ91DRAFT_312060 [Kalaharituber pfeilii]